MRSQLGQMIVGYTSRGLRRYEVTVQHEGLNKFQHIRGDDAQIVTQKAKAKMHQWDQAWEKQQDAIHQKRHRLEQAADVQEKRRLAAERTEEAKAALELLDHILAQTLKVNDAVDWELLKKQDDFPKPEPAMPQPPTKPAPPTVGEQPLAVDFIPRLGFLDHLLPGRRAAKEREAQQRYKSAVQSWKDGVERYNNQVREYNHAISERQRQHDESLISWRQRRQEYLAQCERTNAAIEEKKRRYAAADSEAIVDYCDLVLSRSQYPDYFPQSFDVDYLPANKTLIVDYDLPPLESLPTVKEVSYVQSKDDFVEKNCSDSEMNRLYDNLLYQIALRSIHELFEADVIDALRSIVFNGYISTIDQATGQAIRPCILSLQAEKQEFLGINLGAVEPRACFKKLKGVGSSKLHHLAPVPPVLRINRDDHRFVEGRAVVESVSEGTNLAAMDWEDFEHLIRELFEKEFSQAGGEVKVTRASRDGGVDAVVFDPDPLRGGKIVIQAKRYTNTVGVSAVRDLYGTVMNEGANKGILVCTSEYGPDAYEFAKGKPLVLLSGGELLHLLEKHGHKAKIDLAEAKTLLAQQRD
ncbi:MAG: restriction endonuclease [Verrucomicrobiae bacterium]|nr:restriction endonuclease [Verrucomicrobiae bacterium]